MLCNCCTRASRAERLWHGLYCAWFVHSRAGHKIRAWLAGKAADVCARIIWP